MRKLAKWATRKAVRRTARMAVKRLVPGLWWAWPVIVISHKVVRRQLRKRAENG